MTSGEAIDSQMMETARSNIEFDDLKRLQGLFTEGKVVLQAAAAIIYFSLRRKDRLDLFLAQPRHHSLIGQVVLPIKQA